MLLAAALGACGASGTEPVRYAVLQATVSLDRPSYTVGDSIHVHVTVRNVGLADTVVASVCDRPMVTILYTSPLGPPWQIDSCNPPSDPRGLPIAAGDSVAATWSYRPPAGSYEVRGGVMTTEPGTLISRLQSPSDWLFFDVTP